MTAIDALLFGMMVCGGSAAVVWAISISIDFFVRRERARYRRDLASGKMPYSDHSPYD